MSYEEALKELENILLELEKGEIDLDQAIKLFEKSVELSKICFEKIKTTEKADPGAGSGSFEGKLTHGLKMGVQHHPARCDHPSQDRRAVLRHHR